MAACIGTWTFSKQAVQICAQELCKQCNVVDSVGNAIYAVEDDPETGVYFVGRGAPPSDNGRCQFDAALMKGENCSFGAVAALEGIPTPVKVARKVLDNCKHSMLVGQGAQDFAVKQGFKLEDEAKIQMKQVSKKTEQKASTGHDTLGLLAVDGQGKLCAGVSTSGPGMKTSGRVGDSPLPGAGLFADDTIGAACCTGDGDDIMRYCPSFRTVQLIRDGHCPQDACTLTIQEIAKRHKGPMFDIGIIALNIKGEYGAATSLSEWIDDKTRLPYQGFPYSVWTNQSTDVEVKVQGSCLA